MVSKGTADDADTQPSRTRWCVATPNLLEVFEMERGPEGCSAFTAEVAAASLVLDNCDIKVRAKPLAPPWAQ